ncbi:hypothetical protein PtB15_4B550 [Puccinia triticina]|nr:hypothetical protein PtB15_4B550 [Puccinia triticina]
MEMGHQAHQKPMRFLNFRAGPTNPKSDRSDQTISETSYEGRARGQSALDKRT